MRIFRAPFLFPASSPLVADGAVAVEGGRIAAAGKAKDILRDHPGVPVEDFPDSVILPALVNCHAHLELTALPKISPGVSFVEWIREVVSLKRSAAPRDFERGVREGLRLCLESGQGVVADVASAPGAEKHYGDVGSDDGPRIAFSPELIALDPEGAPEAVERALSRVPSGNSFFSGVFAHAPYTVSGEAYMLAARGLSKRGGLLYTHVAESHEEIEFCLTGRGEIPEVLFGGLPVSPPPHTGMHPVDWLGKNGLLGEKTVLVHCVRLEKSHMEAIAAKRAGVVLCPRSNENLKVGKAPGRALLDEGARVGFGTDSILSAGDLDLWKDVASSLDDYGFSPEEALAAATIGGAGVLGLGGECGSLSAGRRADILVMKLGEGEDPWERIISSPGIRFFLASR